MEDFYKTLFCKCCLNPKDILQKYGEATNFIYSTDNVADILGKFLFKNVLT